MESCSRKTRLCHLFLSHLDNPTKAAIFNCSSAIIHVAAVLINTYQDTKWHKSSSIQAIRSIKDLNDILLVQILIYITAYEEGPAVIY